MFVGKVAMRLFYTEFDFKDKIIYARQSDIKFY